MPRVCALFGKAVETSHHPPPDLPSRLSCLVPRSRKSGHTARYAVLLRLPATSFSLRLAGVVAEVFAAGLEAFGASFAARL
jgi:hypothetical protein